jgi:hypothetical protein
VPSGNLLLCSRAERVSTSTLAAVCQRAGRYNTLNRCDIQVHGAIDAVQVDSSDGTSRGLRLQDCFLSGEAGVSTAIRCTGTEAPAVILEGMNFWENFTVGLAVGDDTNVEIMGGVQGSVTTFLSPLGTKTAPGLVIQRILRIDGTPSDVTGIPAGLGNTVATFYDATNHKVWFYSGAWRGVTVS